MNLINDRWIPVRRKSGLCERIAPFQIAEMDDPVVDLDAPRPDFQGALYQFLIGLLQTVYAPEDSGSWYERLLEPDVDEVSGAFASLQDAMQLLNPDGPAFLQDFDMPDSEPKPIAALLIEAPGGKTLKDNLDHFVKGGQVPTMCLSCAASALFTLQANAPAGGVGHRVGLRGGGPLTTLMVPSDTEATLWQKLWLNVLVPDDDYIPEADDPLSPKVLPWMGPTRTSETSGVATSPDDGHPLQMYWGMPRRIRLEASDETGCCSLCGAEDQALVSQYRTRNYGTNYTDHWIHPLTPFRFDPKKKNPPLSLKGQQGGLGYRHWIGLALGTAENGDTRAKVVSELDRERIGMLAVPPSLWCFGYDMDNMKARCWYEHHFPILACSGKQREHLLECCKEMLALFQLAVKTLRTQVKEAWFNRAKDAKGDVSFVETDFWQSTEAEFFNTVASISTLEDRAETKSAVMQVWRVHVIRMMMDTFDRWTLESSPEDLNLKRIMTARAQLERFVIRSKLFKQYSQRYPTDQKESA